MKKSKFIPFIITVLIMSISQMALAADAPHWVRKGVKNLNQQRSNDTYEFASFNTWNLDLQWLKDNRTDPIGEYLVAQYGAQPASIEFIPVGTQPIQYKILFVGQDGENYAVDARLIDEFSEFDDYELNYFQFEFYQLYAISRPNVTPNFDHFELTTKYTGVSTALSFVPGMAQLYKGQDTKAYIIIGGEVALVGAALIFEYKRHDASVWEQKEPGFAGSWHSKALGWRNLEIGAFALAGGLYIYNIIDGIKSKGARQVVMKKAKKSKFAVLPFAAPHEAGMCLTLNF